MPASENGFVDRQDSSQKGREMDQMHNRLPISFEDLQRRRAETGALVARLLTHYWTAAEPIGVRQAQAEDWIEDLCEFLPAQVNEACRRWRRSQSRKPTIADIRALAIEERDTRTMPAEEGAWPAWLAETWGAEPEGPRRRAEALARSKELVDEIPDTIAGQPWRAKTEDAAWKL
jgi:hypothetical protein